MGTELTNGQHVRPSQKIEHIGEFGILRSPRAIDDFMPCRGLARRSFRIKPREIARPQEFGDDGVPARGIPAVKLAPVVGRKVVPARARPRDIMAPIVRRQDGIETLLANRSLLRDLRDRLGEVRDMERVTARLSAGRCLVSTSGRFSLSQSGLSARSTRALSM